MSVLVTLLSAVCVAVLFFLCSHLVTRLVLSRRYSLVCLPLLLLLRRLRKGGRQFFSFEDCLPSLPLPRLDHSVDKYLSSVAALLPPTQLEEHRAAVLAAQGSSFWGFPLFGPFASLQRSLAAEAFWKRNWLSHMWLQHVYLEKRSPLAFFSNYYLLDSPSSLSSSLDQLGRCVSHLRIIQHLLLVAWSGKQRHPPFLLRSSIPYSTHNYKTCFATTRVPDRTDVLRVFEKSRHVAVIRHRELFCFDLVEASGEAVRAEQLIANVKYLLDLRAPDTPVCAVANLTCDDRTVWATNRARWFNSGLNKASLAAVESALFVLCLDDDSPNSNQEAANWAFVGSGGNRWFDKSLQYVIWKNGRVGLNCEHSALDRHVPMHLLETLVQSETDENFLPSIDLRQRATYQHQPRVKRLQWLVTPGLESAVALAGSGFSKLAQDSNLFVLEFHGYGKSFIAQRAKANSNSWLQMCLQLAFFRHRKRFVLTYESCELRYFAEGRTECIRPLSVESAHWCKMMQSQTASRDEKVSSLLAAMRVHGRRARDAERGKGFDRHLFGLFVTSVQQQNKVAQQVLSQMLSIPFDLSTHQHPVARHKGKAGSIDGGGCCASTKAGYSVGFVAKSDATVFHIHSWRTVAHPEIDSRSFAGFVEQALLDMRALFE